MSTEMSRKDETAVAKVTERAKPTLVTIGNKQVISSGRWNNDLIADYVQLHGRSKWISIGELAKVAYGQNIPRSKERVRKCLSELFKTLLLKRGELLVIETDAPSNRAKAVMLFDGGSVVHKQNMQLRLERMRKRRELTALQWETAMKLLDTRTPSNEAA